MKELFTMWKSTRMIVLTAVTAALYAAILIPFKGFSLVPGFTQVRPANVIPVVCSLLFGPAAAWGSAIGNLIGDLFGTFGTGSIFGFIGNFFYGLVPYVLWSRLGALSSGEEPNMRSGKSIVEYEIVALIASIACGVWIAWGLEALKVLPFAVLGSIIPLNNFIMSAVIGPVLMALLYSRVKRWGLIWTDIMPAEDISTGAGTVGSWLMVIGAIGALVVGMFMSLGLGTPLAAAGFKFGGNPQYVGTGGVVFGAGIFILMLLLSLFTARPNTGTAQKRMTAS